MTPQSIRTAHNTTQGPTLLYDLHTFFLSQKHLNYIYNPNVRYSSLLKSPFPNFDDCFNRKETCPLQPGIQFQTYN